MTTQPFAGDCFRCGGLGHWADSGTCPWLVKAKAKAEHLARIEYYVNRYTGFVITEWQKREFIKQENKLWYDGKTPAQLI